MTRNEITRRFPNASEAFIQANLGTGQAPSLTIRGLAHPTAQPDARTALAKELPVKPRRKGRLARGHGPAQVRVTMVACHHRLVDPDACSQQCKALTDLVAAELGVDDADPRVAWEWSQIETRGEEGVIVKVEPI